MPYINTEISNIYFFAQVYGSDVYGANTYQCNETNCLTEQDGGTGGGILAPATGYLQNNPWAVAPVILVLAVVVALSIAAVKKYIRYRRG